MNNDFRKYATRHLGMNSKRIVVDTFCYAENNYGLKVEGAYFGMNLVYNGGGTQNKDYLNQISQNYQNYVTLQKATK